MNLKNQEVHPNKNEQFPNNSEGINRQSFLDQEYFKSPNIGSNSGGFFSRRRSIKKNKTFTQQIEKQVSNRVIKQVSMNVFSSTITSGTVTTIATVGLIATLATMPSVSCAPQKIYASSANLNVNIISLLENKNIRWVLLAEENYNNNEFEPVGDNYGKIEDMKSNLFLIGLEADTSYIVVFYEDGANKALEHYQFKTGLISETENKDDSPMVPDELGDEGVNLEPTPEPTSDPTPEPTPEPTSDPTLESTPEPTSEPTPEPEPESTPEPEPENVIPSNPVPPDNPEPTPTPSETPDESEETLYVDPTAIEPTVSVVSAQTEDSVGAYDIIFSYQLNDATITDLTITGASSTLELYGQDVITREIYVQVPTTSIEIENDIATYRYRVNADENVQLTGILQYDILDKTTGEVIRNGSIESNANYSTSYLTYNDYDYTFETQLNEDKTAIECILTINDIQNGTFALQITDIEVGHTLEDGMYESIMFTENLPAVTNPYVFEFEIPYDEQEISTDGYPIVNIDVTLLADCMIDETTIYTSDTMKSGWFKESYGIEGMVYDASAEDTALFNEFGLTGRYKISFMDTATSEEIWDSGFGITPDSLINAYITYFGVLTKPTRFEPIVSSSVDDINIEPQSSVYYPEGTEDPTIMFTFYMPRRDVTINDFVIENLIPSEELPT